jgi:hypothetical protein
MSATSDRAPRMTGSSQIRGLARPTRGAGFTATAPRISAASRLIACWSMRSLRMRSRDDFDRGSDANAEVKVGTPLIHGDFGEPVGILIPKCRPWREIAKGP